MIRSARRTYDIYPGDYIGGRFAGMGGLGTKISIPTADQTLQPMETDIPVTGGPGPMLLSEPHTGELGPQVTTQAMAEPKNEQLPAINPSETEPLRIAVQSQQAVAQQDQTRDVIVLAALGIGGAMAIYAIVEGLRRRRGR